MVESIPQYYSDLLIAQFKSKPKAKATIELIAECFALVDKTSNIPLLIKVRNAFNLIDDNLAEGIQLDTVGKYANIKRSGYGAISKKQITLDDSDYRQLIKLKTVLNSLGSSLADIDDFIDSFFPGQLRLTDLGNMNLIYVVTNKFGSRELLERVIYENLLPKPMGVNLSTVLYVPVGGPFFGFKNYDKRTLSNFGFNTYANYLKTKPWLTYDYEIETRNFIEG